MAYPTQPLGKEPLMVSQPGYPAGPGYNTPGYPTPGYPGPGGAPGLPNVPGMNYVAAQMQGPSARDIPTTDALLAFGRLYVQQKIDFLELFVDYDVSNTYEVFVSEETRKAGAAWLMAKEDSECIQRVCFPPCREFDMDVGIAGGPKGNKTAEEKLGLVSGKYVYPMIRIHRPCFFCLPSFTVSDQQGIRIGAGRESCISLIPCCPIEWKIWGPTSNEEAGAAPDYELKGPSRLWIHCVGQCPCRDPFDFKLKDARMDRHVGKVSNVPNGCLKMCFTNADNYEVDFDPSATKPERGTLLALSFLLDFRFFEQKQQKNNSL